MFTEKKYWSKFTKDVFYYTIYKHSPSQTNTQSISLKNEESLFRDKRMINKKKKEKKKKFSLSSYYVSDTVTLSLLMSLNFYWTVFFSTYTYLMIYTHKKDFIFNQVTNQGYDVSAGEEQSHECNSVIITHVLSVIPQTSKL